MENLKEITLTQWSVVLGVLFLLSVVIATLRAWIANVKDYEYQTVEAIDGLADGNDCIKKLLEQGYVFCFLWKIQDIQTVAHSLGHYLTDQDCVKVASIIKERWNPETGISNDVIRDAVLSYCFPDGQSKPLTFEDYGH